MSMSQINRITQQYKLCLLGSSSNYCSIQQSSTGSPWGAGRFTLSFEGCAPGLLAAGKFARFLRTHGFGCLRQGFCFLRNVTQMSHLHRAEASPIRLFFRCFVENERSN